MGTNYFCITKEDNKKRHLGKKSCGWAFLFHGYIEDDFSIRGYADWQKTLLQNGICILDEYGEKIKKRDFFHMVEQSLPETRTGVLNNNESWHDKDGFAFLTNYFS